MASGSGLTEPTDLSRPCHRWPPSHWAAIGGHTRRVTASRQETGTSSSGNAVATRRRERGRQPHLEANRSTLWGPTDGTLSWGAGSDQVGWAIDHRSGA